MPDPEQISALQLAIYLVIFVLLAFGSVLAGQGLSRWAHRSGQRRADREVAKIGDDLARERAARDSGACGEPWAHQRALQERGSTELQSGLRPLHQRAGNRAGLRGDFSGMGRETLNLVK